jgi:hypothetical protein
VAVEKASLGLAFLSLVSAFVDCYSFSHRYSSDQGLPGFCGYEEITHQCQLADAPALVRSFAHFLTGCGFSPSSVYGAMESIGEEYNEAYVDKMP